MVVRILALHGYSQNAIAFEKRLTALRKTCGAEVEFVCLAGPLLLASQLPNTNIPAFDSSDAIEANESRAWIQWRKDDPNHHGFPETLALLRDTLSERHFDGVLGFSQGAAMAALLCALLERPHIYPPFSIDGKAPHPPLKFCIAVSGFRVPGTIGDLVFPKNMKFDTPTLHIIARNDSIVAEKSSRELAALWKISRVEIHEGGHRIPTQQSWSELMARSQ
ncbi:FSH1 domain-containing protein [Mycena indigotica]|uniref:FSH1 domain-containing protein n=1 Tax=Mycena indigotica TaxID=2126181 RepID=A0A8H6THR7_9AGAR|nr:FSH1 domain-containing protein [Mycena indigotica]KAF7315955.1 FSH1 domain-containing protein [Mycena indigotica]